MLKNVKFRTKIFLGFFILLVLFIGVGIESYHSLTDSTDGFQKYRKIARETNLVGRIQANMLMARMNVKDYIITGREEDVNKFKEYFEKTGGFLQEAKQEIDQTQRRAMINEIDEAFQTYQGAFTRLSELIRERNRLVKEGLDVKGPRMEQNLSKLLFMAFDGNDLKAAYYSGLAMKHLLSGRFHMAKFLDTDTPAHANEALKEFEELQAQLNAMKVEIKDPERRTLVEEVEKNNQEYLTASNNLVELIGKRDSIIQDTLDRIGPMVANKVEDIKLHYKAEQDDLGPRLVAENNSSKRLIAIVGLLALLLGLGLSVLITKAVTRPVQRILGFSELLQRGDLSAVLPTGKDEFGRMGVSLNALVETMRTKATAATAIAKGDLNQEIEVASEQDTLGLALRDMVESLNNMINNLLAAAEQVNAGSLQVSDSSQSLSQGATEQASSLEEITSSITQIAAQTKTNAENASQASQLALETRTAGESGAERMEEMIRAMSAIDSSSKEIQKIIKAIDDIAFQTNLLALNAAVEAARAGKHGKGFAVVAQEVRTLAARSAKAAQETAELIEKSSQRVLDGNHIAKDTKDALEEINTRITKVTDLVGEIAAASSEQAQGITQVNQGLAQIDGVTQQNTANAEETSAAAEELASQAGYVRQILSGFRIKGSSRHLTDGSKENRAAVIPLKSIRRKSAESSPTPVPSPLAIENQDFISLDDREYGRY